VGICFILIDFFLVVGNLEERYGTRDGYLTAVRAAAERLKAQRLLLSEDAESLIKAAQSSDVLK
jgi:hypothetical protein